MVQIDRALVERIAELGRLSLSESEVETYARQLQGILAYVDKLALLDTAQVEPMVHALENANVFRADEVRPSIPLAQALRNAPDRVEVFFKVPKVIEETE